MDSLKDDFLIHRRGQLGQAWFSGDRFMEHRFLLLRGGDIDDGIPLVVFIMLNPSTADEDQNDPTIAKCIKFAAKFTSYTRGHDPTPVPREHRVAIVNLYAIRATDPDVAFRHPRPVGGQRNDAVIVDLARHADLVIAAWGADKRSAGRAAEVRRMLRDKVNVSGNPIVLHRLGSASKDGSPKHPLYLKDATDLEVYSW